MVEVFSKIINSIGVISLESKIKNGILYYNDDVEIEVAGHDLFFWADVIQDYNYDKGNKEFAPSWDYNDPEIEVVCDTDCICGYELNPEQIEKLQTKIKNQIVLI